MAKNWDINQKRVEKGCIWHKERDIMSPHFTKGMWILKIIYPKKKKTISESNKGTTYSCEYEKKKFKANQTNNFRLDFKFVFSVSFLALLPFTSNNINNCNRIIIKSSESTNSIHIDIGSASYWLLNDTLKMTKLRWLPHKKYFYSTISTFAVIPKRNCDQHKLHESQNKTGKQII